MPYHTLISSISSGTILYADIVPPNLKLGEKNILKTGNSILKNMDYFCHWQQSATSNCPLPTPITMQEKTTILCSGFPYSCLKRHNKWLLKEETEARFLIIIKFLLLMVFMMLKLPLWLTDSVTTKMYQEQYLTFLFSWHHEIQLGLKYLSIQHTISII